MGTLHPRKSASGVRKQAILLAITLLERERRQYFAGNDSYVLQGARHSYAMLAHKKVEQCNAAINEMVKLLVEKEEKCEK